jgi:hypothetical protein
MPSSVFGDYFESNVNCPCVLRAPDGPPKWLNKKLYLEGLRFFRENIFFVYAAYCLNLVTGLCVPNLRWDCSAIT